jgi:N-acetylmuramoyl-L-alanine amidase
VSLVTVARPKDVDLAVPPLTPGQPSGLTLRQIVDGYSQWVTKDWARACNVEYRAGPSGPSVSLIAEGGTVWTTGDLRWPVMLATKDGISIKEFPSEAEVKAARWAFSAGPWLVRDGKTADIAAEIKGCGFSGLAEGSRRERAAIGIREDGSIVHYADLAMTLYDLAAKMRALGCRDAINLDGGGSVGVIDSSGKVVLGYASRQVCCALVFRRLIDDSLPQDSQPSQPPQPPQPKGGDQMIVCIDPGHGGPDPGAVSPSGIQEKKVTLTVAKRVAEYLRRAGVKVALTRDKDMELVAGNDSAAELRARAKVANDAKADFFLSIHCNAASTPDAEGFEVYHYPGSTKGAMLATKIAGAYALASGLKRRKVATANFQVLRDTVMPAALIELGFLTNKADCALLRELAFQDKIALGIAFGILEMRA